MSLVSYCPAQRLHVTQSLALRKNRERGLLSLSLFFKVVYEVHIEMGCGPMGGLERERGADFSADFPQKFGSEYCIKKRKEKQEKSYKICQAYKVCDEHSKPVGNNLAFNTAVTTI